MKKFFALIALLLCLCSTASVALACETDVPEVSAKACAAFAKGQDLFNDEEYYDAVPYLEIAAEGGHLLGGRLYAWCLLYGKGTEADPREAVYYFTRAAVNGDAEAQYELGYCYYAGQGVQRDYEQAVEWYETAAAQDHAKALTNLGYCYEHGLGVDRNNDTARELYVRVINAGNSRAWDRLNELEKKIFGL